MGHKEHGLAVRRPQRKQQVAHHAARLRVQRAEGLVHEQDGGIADEHLGERHALALAAGELMGIAINKTGEAHTRQQGPSPLTRLRGRHAPHFQRHGHIGQRGLPGHERVLLEQIARLRRDARDPAAMDPGEASGGGQKPRHHIQQGGLAAARGAHDGNELACGDLQRNPGDRLIGGGPDAETHADLFEGDNPRFGGDGVSGRLRDRRHGHRRHGR